MRKWYEVKNNLARVLTGPNYTVIYQNLGDSLICN